MSGLRARRRVRRRLDESTASMSTINITPFTDVLLVLLIIFMIAGSSLSELTGLALDGELAAHGAPEDETVRAEALMVEVFHGGEVTGTWRNTDLSGDLFEHLPLDLEVTVSSRPDVPSGAVIEAYDRLVTLGFSKVSLGSPLPAIDESEEEPTSVQTP